MTTSAQVNKAEWIRSQSRALSAKEVDNAKQQGITLSVSHVYNARSTAAKGGNRRTVVGQGGVGVQLQPSSKLHQQFLEIALRLGTDQAQQLLSDLATGKSLRPGL